MKNLTYSKKSLNITPSPTLRMSALASELKQQGLDVVGLTAGEPDFPTPLHIKESAIKAINQNFSKYTANSGIIELREAIANKLRTENKIECTAKNIVVTNGAKHALFNAIQSICNKNDEVIIGSPYWVSYPELIKLADAKPVIIKTTEKTNFKVSAKQLKNAISKKTKAFIFSSPSNPTGNIYTENELLEIAELADKYKFFIIADEIYEKILYDGNIHCSVGSISEIKNQVITVNGVSKAFAMTGWRLGYLCANNKISEICDNLQGQMTSNASSISQKAALEALTNKTSKDQIEKMKSTFEERRNYLYQVLCSIPKIKCLKPEGAFFLFPNVEYYLNGKVKNVDDLCEFFLKEEKLAFVAGSGFGSKNCIRLSYAASMENLEKAAERFINGFKKLA